MGFGRDVADYLEAVAGADKGYVVAIFGVSDEQFAKEAVVVAFAPSESCSGSGEGESGHQHDEGEAQRYGFGQSCSFGSKYNRKVDFGLAYAVRSGNELGSVDLRGVYGGWPVS